MNQVQLLVSVRNGVEAEAAMRGGADIIDAKEPANGALGAVDPRTLQSIAVTVGTKRPFSVACGELCAMNEEADRHRGHDGLDRSRTDAICFYKFGLAGAAGFVWQRRAASWSVANGRGQLVVVAYADFKRAAAPDPADVVAWVARQSNVHVLIDTAVKDGTSLFDWLNEGSIADMVESAQRHETMIGLAGSLKGDAFASAVSLRPDVVGVRGAACEGTDRNASITAARVRELADVIAVHNTRPAMLSTQPAD